MDSPKINGDGVDTREIRRHYGLDVPFEVDPDPERPAGPSEPPQNQEKERAYERPVVRDRMRIQAELRRELGQALEDIVARSSRASAAARADPPTAANELHVLVAESRHALADARRLIGGYQRASVRGELDAALTLLETAGVEAELVIATDRSLEAVDQRAQLAIRSVVVHALRDDSLERCVLELAENDMGQLDVRLVTERRTNFGLEEVRP